MNPIDTPLFTAKDVYTALNAIRERLDALAKLPTDSGSVVWARQLSPNATIRASLRFAGYWREP